MPQLGSIGASIGVVVCEAPMGIVSALFPRKPGQRGSIEEHSHAWFDESIMSHQEKPMPAEAGNRATEERKVTQAELRALFRTRLQSFD